MKIAYLLGILALTFPTIGNCSSEFRAGAEDAASIDAAQDKSSVYKDAARKIYVILQDMTDETVESDIPRINEALRSVNDAIGNNSRGGKLEVSVVRHENDTVNYTVTFRRLYETVRSLEMRIHASAPRQVRRR
jgi:hypothetical protein